MSDAQFYKILELISECTVGIYEDEKLLGSGVIISPVGFIGTCAHVIEQKKKVSVKVGGKYVTADVYKQDTSIDLAVLKLPKKDLRNYLYIEGNSTVKQGQKVFILGFPYSTYSETTSPSLSEGIISRVHIDETAEVPFIQIDVTVVAGNSGGPVFDVNGKIIGLVTTKLFDGMACCIPIKRLVSLVPSYELYPSSKLFSDYAKKETDAYRAWTLFDNYVDLRCSEKAGGQQDLTEYVRYKWLPSQSKALLAVLGEFGSGKTLFCHKLTNELLKEYIPGRSLPFLIKLRDMKEYRYKSLKDLLVDQIGTKLGFPHLTWPTLEEILRLGEILLIYDGFEEMTMKASRFQMADSFREILSTMVPETKTIITCRTHYFSTEDEIRILTKSKRPDQVESLILEESNPDKVSIVYLEPFDDTDIRFYLERKLKDWQSLYRRINDPNFYDLADLAKRPIFLDVIVESIPDLDSSGLRITGTQLYQLYTTQCFKRETARISLSLEQQSEIMEELAFEAYKDRLTLLSRKLIEAVWASVIPNKAEPDAEKFIRNYPFLRKAEGSRDKLDFIHQSFFEFFVAKGIFRSISNHYHTSYATEYLTSPIDKYLFELLETNNDIGIIVNWLKRHPNINVRMNCALTIQRSRHIEFIPVLHECLEQERDIGVAGRIADALAGLGDKQSLLRFLGNLEKYAQLQEDTGKPESNRLLYDIVEPLEDIDQQVVNKVVKNLNHSNSRIRKFAAFSLGRIRALESVPGLITLLDNSDESIRARRYAAAALGIIGSPSALTTLQSIAEHNESEILRQECLKASQRIMEGS
ncbi:MAG: hypothetical protein QOH25_2513 [Acidobacteriota bacterium]|jgi:hypothetical protein|nr:hypothetical protein [Acidobacteriota bacterium]